MGEKKADLGTGTVQTASHSDSPSSISRALGREEGLRGAHPEHGAAILHTSLFSIRQDSLMDDTKIVDANWM